MTLSTFHVILIVSENAKIGTRCPVLCQLLRQEQYFYRNYGKLYRLFVLSRYFNFIIFQTKPSLCPNHQAFLFCSCKYYVWFEKRTNKGYLPLQNFRMKQAQQVLSMIFFYIWRNQCYTFLLSWCFNKIEILCHSVCTSILFKCIMSTLESFQWWHLTKILRFLRGSLTNHILVKYWFGNFGFFNTMCSNLKCVVTYFI